MTMPTSQIHAKISGPIVMIGFGSIGKGTLPLIERHFDYDKSRFVIIDPHEDGELAKQHGVRFIKQGGDEGQLPRAAGAAFDGGRRPGLLRQPVGRHLLGRHHEHVPRDRRALHRHGDRAVARLLFRQQRRTGEALELCAARDAAHGEAQSPGGPTAVSTCGANPGMVSWFVKQALVNLAKDTGLSVNEPGSREGWGELARKLGVKGIHIAERDTQRSKKPKPRDVFVNTWSVEGFVSEGMQPAELGWGTHEKWMPENGRDARFRLQGRDLPAAAGRQHARPLMVPDAGRAIRLPRHPQRVDLDRRLFHGA